MKIILSCVHIIVSLLLIVAVLVQQRKQGGFSGVFGGGSQPDSGQWQRFTPLTKITIALAVIFMVTSFFIVFLN